MCPEAATVVRRLVPTVSRKARLAEVPMCNADIGPRFEPDDTDSIVDSARHRRRWLGLPRSTFRQVVPALQCRVQRVSAAQLRRANESGVVMLAVALGEFSLADCGRSAAENWRMFGGRMRSAFGASSRCSAEVDLPAGTNVGSGHPSRGRLPPFCESRSPASASTALVVAVANRQTAAAPHRPGASQSAVDVSVPHYRAYAEWP